MALAIAGVPRGTAEVGINVFVELERIGTTPVGCDGRGAGARAMGHGDV